MIFVGYLGSMSKKNTNSQTFITQLLDDEDASNIQAVARRMLVSIDETIQCLTFINAAELDDLERAHNLMFGSKNSLADALVTVTDLLIKVKQSKAEANREEVAAEQSYKGLSEADIAIVQAFVKNVKSTEAEI